MHTTPRRILFWLHLTAGVIAGTVIFFLAVTGACLAFERQMISHADRYYQITQASGERHAIADMITAAQAYVHAPASVVAIHSDPSAPVEVSVGREPAKILLLNPYSGAVLGESAPHLRAFFTQVTALHRWFGMQGRNRTTARAIKGAFTLSMLFLVCSGVILWLPRKWTRQHIGKSLLLRRNLQGRARDWNWHNVIGIWLAVPLSLIALTGVIMAYPWANDLLYHITGNTPPPRQTENTARDQLLNRKLGEEHPHTPKAATNFDALVTTAGEQVPGWRTITLRLQNPDANTITLQIDRGDGGRPDLRSQITLDNMRGRILHTETFSSYNRGHQLRLWTRFTHSGEAGGFIGEAIAGLTSLGAAVLAWTGLSLALRRFLFSRKRKVSRNTLAGVVSTAQGMAASGETSNS